MNKERLVTLSLMVLAAAVSRLLPHPDNVAPIAAIALFAGAHFERKSLAVAIPLAAMLASDLVIGLYAQMWVTYLAFALIVCLGFALRGRARPLPVIGAALGGSMLFFLLTNNAFLVHPGMYPQTLDGMMQGYTAAIPFFRNTLLGDLFYVGLLFGGFALAERKYPKLRLVSA